MRPLPDVTPAASRRGISILPPRGACNVQSVPSHGEDAFPHDQPEDEQMAQAGAEGKGRPTS